MASVRKVEKEGSMWTGRLGLHRFSMALISESTYQMFPEISELSSAFKPRAIYVIDCNSSWSRVWESNPHTAGLIVVSLFLGCSAARRLNRSATPAFECTRIPELRLALFRFWRVFCAYCSQSGELRSECSSGASFHTFHAERTLRIVEFLP